MKKALMLLVILVIIGVGAYIVFKPNTSVAPATATPADTIPVKTKATQSATEKPPANVGATGVYDANAPQGSPAECAQCAQYSGSQKAQCLVALHC